MAVLFNFFLLFFHCFIHFSMNCLQNRRMIMARKSNFSLIPLFLSSVNNADRIFGICCSQIEVVSALGNDQGCSSSDRFENASAGPGVEQPVAEDDVGGSFEASSSVQGVGKGWPGDRECKIRNPF